MAEKIARPVEPYPTRSRTLYEHMREYGYPVVLVTDDDEEERCERSV